MVGQKKLLSIIDNSTLDNFPKSVLLLGPQGCGKHTLLKIISNKLNLQCFDITDVVSFDYINELYQRSIPAIYYIDMDQFTEKKQNIILKFLEEPLNNSYIILLSNDKSLLLETIVNRCIVYEFEEYTSTELEQFIESGENVELILNVLKTPGQILSSNTNNLNKLYNLCVTIVNKLQIAGYANTLSISNKINYKDEYDKFDIDVFYNMLAYVMLQEFIKTNNKMICSMYFKTNEYKKRLRDKRLNKQQFFENYITCMWKLVRVKED